MCYPDIITLRPLILMPCHSSKYNTMANDEITNQALLENGMPDMLGNWEMAPPQA